MKIAFKILSGYLVISVLLVAMGVLVIRTSAVLNPVMAALDEEVNNLNVALTFTDLTSQIVFLRSQLRHTASQYYFTKDARDVEKYANTLNKMNKSIHQIINESIKEEDRKIFKNLKSSTDKLANFEKRFMDLVKEDQAKSYALFSQDREYQQLNNSISNFINSYSYGKKVESTDVFSRLITISDSIQRSRVELNLQSNITLLLISVVSIASLLVGVIVSRSISTPIGALKQTTELLAAGDMSVRSNNFSQLANYLFPIGAVNSH